MTRDARTAAGAGRARLHRQPRAAPEEADKRGNLATTHPAAAPEHAAGDGASAGAGTAAHRQAQQSDQLRRQADTGGEVRRTGSPRRQRSPADPQRPRQKEP